MAGAPSRLRDYEVYQRVGTKGPIWMFGLNLLHDRVERTADSCRGRKMK